MYWLDITSWLLFLTPCCIVSTALLYVTTSSSCSNLLTTRSSTSGIIYSNKHGSYTNGMTCQWSLSSNSNLELIFFRLQTESKFDFVKVYDGGSSSDPLIGRYEGTSMPGVITSSSNQLYITFRSDGSSTRSGFAASYHGKLKKIIMSLSQWSLLLSSLESVWLREYEG